MFLYMWVNVLRRSGKCCATVRGMFLCGEGFDSEDGFIDFSKVTLFIGDQGTGETTVAKSFSLCSWLEKSFFFVVIMMQPLLELWISMKFAGE